MNLLKRILNDIQNSCCVVYRNKINENDDSYWQISSRPAYLNATVDFLVAEQKCKEWIASKQSTNETDRHFFNQKLLDTNKKNRHSDPNPSDLIDASFVVDKEEYKIN